MTFDEFITKWTGQPVDTDGVYPNQCMDLMHQYCLDVLGVANRNDLAQPAAKDVFVNYPNEAGATNFDRITNTPSFIPQKGDILFFGSFIGQYGHVCIFISGDTVNFQSFDANWPLGSLPHIQKHTYDGVLGVLRFKGLPPPPQTPGGEETVNDQTQIDMGEGFGRMEVQAVRSTLHNQATIIGNNAAHLQQLADELASCSQQNSVLGQEIKDFSAYDIRTASIGTLLRYIVAKFGGK